MSRRTQAFLLSLLVLNGCDDSTARTERELGSRDPAVRRAAAQELGTSESGGGATIAALRSALADEDAQVRRLACRGLARHGERAVAAVAELTGLLGDQDPAVRLAAAFALAEIVPDHEGFAPVLIQAMRSGDGGVIVTVGQMGTRATWSVPILLELLENDPRPGIRRLAAEALQQVGAGSSEVAAALADAARSDPDDRVREVAAAATD